MSFTFPMPTLTPSSAHHLLIEISKDIHPLRQREFILVHSEKVAQMGKKLAIHSHFNPEFFEIAGRIHDIGYARDEKNHANESLNILKEKGYNIDSVLQDCIINHGSSKQPHTAEGRLFQLIDKLSFFGSRYHRTSPEIGGTSSLERIFKQKLSISVNFTR